MELKQDFITLIENKYSDSKMRIELLDTLPSISIRVNKSKVELPNKFEKVLWSDFGYYLPQRPSFTFDPLFHAGAYYVQEASSMFLEQALKQTLDLEKDIIGLDLCAAPGGKSTHIASLISDNSLLVSNEVIKSRAQILKENVVKSGFGNTIVTNNRVEDFKSLNGVFDFVVVDAPCSGEGMFRKDLNAREEWSLDNVKLCASRQKNILGNIYSSLKENGILIYSTCTFNSFENEENIKWLTENFDVESIRLKIDERWNISEVESKNVFGYQFFPGQVKGEGFFISVFKKTKPEKLPKSLKRVQLKKSKISEVENWISSNNIYEEDEIIFALNPQWEKEFLLINKDLLIVYKGLELAEKKKKNLIPLHSLALSNKLNTEQFQSAEVDYDTAIQYLKKENINVESEKGNLLIFYKGLPLGFCKSLGNRVNNNYPKEWRIRSKEAKLKPFEL